MSRIGNRILEIPANVEVKVENNIVSVKGPKGELSTEINKNINVEVKDNTVVVTRKSDEFKNFHGTTNANIKNMISDMNKVMVTGTADHSKIDELVKRLGVDVDVMDSFFVDPSCLSFLSNYDGIIIVEQRDYSDLKLIDEELSLVNNTHAKLIGAIII